MGVIKKAKNAAKKVVAFFKKLVNMIKFLATPVGYVVGIIVLVIFLIFVIYVIAESVWEGLKMWWEGDDYTGFATTEDYDILIDGISYEGYDSYIPEEKVQEYAAFEYAVLMDVAEHIYENQDYTTIKTVNGIPYDTSAVFPEGEVIKQYDADIVSKEWWKDAVVKAQDGRSAPSISNSPKTILGGNREVTTPRLIYEVSSHQSEDSAVSLVPYIVVVREDLEYTYYIEGDYTLNVNNGIEIINNEKLEPVRFSSELNRFNYNVPNSAYKKDLEKDQNGKDVLGVEDKEGFVKADRVWGYGDDIYYTEKETDIIYKIPLKLLINRYLPKATLLTSWYMLKDSAEFKVDDMMDEIKGIYNAACYKISRIEDSIDAITVTGKKNSETGAIEATSGITLRTGEESYETGKVESVIYDESGTKKKNDSGDVEFELKDIEYASTNKRTFIYFEQYGLETNQYELYKAYNGPSGDGEKPNSVSPVANYLTKDRATFVDHMDLHLMYIAEYPYTYIADYDEDGKPIYETIMVREDRPWNGPLKTDYSFREQDDLDEEYKKSYLIGDSPNIIQECNFESFMLSVASRAQEILIQKFGNPRVVKYVPGTTNDETIYDHYFINQLYIRADIGSGDKDNPNTEYKLPEDFRYYNHKEVSEPLGRDLLPFWYDLKGMKENGIEDPEAELKLAYMQAFLESYKSNSEAVMAFFKAYDSEAVGYHSDYAIYIGEGLEKYNEAVYTIKEEKPTMSQTIHQTRMPALLVKYCDMWSKSVEYTNRVVQNNFNPRNYKYLIPMSITSLGIQDMNISENSTYRTGVFAKYFNKKEGVAGTEGLKEADILNMLIQWENYAADGKDESTYAFMRELYKLTLYIRDYEKTMLDTAYSYLYMPSTISNFKDGTSQKIFWLERLAATKGVDELTKEEQNTVRTRAIDTKWQNLEYDEYSECVYDVGNTEEANVYALFPYGAPIIRSYYMLKRWNDIVSPGQDYQGDKHPAVDISSRKYINFILAAKNTPNTDTVERQLYFYELNRLTLKYMQNGYMKEDAFSLAEKTLDNMLKEYSLNSPIVAVARGRVTKVDYNSRSGFHVEIRHDSSDDSTPQIRTFYAHFKRWPLVEEGEIVGAGTILGYEGTTGRSTGNHLHFELTVNGEKVNPYDYIIPVFSPFYYDIKAKTVLDKDMNYALGSEYYTLERTILPENALYNNNIVIDGMTMTNGIVISGDVKIATNRTKTYAAGDFYNSGDNDDDEPIGASPYNVIWGNNVPSGEMATTLDDIIDIGELNKAVPFNYGLKPSGDTSGKVYPDKGDSYSGDIGENLEDVTAKPVFFTSNKNDFEVKYKDKGSTVSYESDYENGEHKRLEWPKWFAVEMAEYKSELAVFNYSGPRNKTEAISTEKALNDLKKIQTALKRLGYYQKAGRYFEEVGHGTYSDEFEDVVIALQEDLINKGYGVYGVTTNGSLDQNTISAYNAMVSYTTEENQYALAQKVSYNSGVNLSIEPALALAVIHTESNIADRCLTLKENSGDKGLMQIQTTDENMILPMRNTNKGMKTIKENMIYFYQNYSKNIYNAKNNTAWITFSNGCCDIENADRLILYALALDAYNQGDVSLVNVNSILSNGPSGYAKDVLDKFKTYIVNANK